MAAVLFADLVGYSRKAVSDQVAAKDSLGRLLQRALAPIAPDSRIVLDTGDGVAVTFLSDPEHAVYFAMRLRSELQSGADVGLLRPEDLRLGINLGPVKRTVDLNGQPNLVGEGINTAERIMSFAVPGDTTVSRSFRDAVSCLRASYRTLFEPIGTRTDKHGREHEVFRLVSSAGALEEAELSLGYGDGEAGHAVAAAPERNSAAGRASAPAARSGHPARAWLLTAGIAATAAAAWMALAPDRPSAPLVQPQPAPVIAPDPKPAASVPAEPKPIEPVPAASTSEPPNAGVPVTAAPAAPAAHVDRVNKRSPTGPSAAPAGAASPRCSLLLQRAALGDKLGTAEQEEMRTCR